MANLVTNSAFYLFIYLLGMVHNTEKVKETKCKYNNTIIKANYDNRLNITNLQKPQNKYYDKTVKGESFEVDQLYKTQ